MPLSLVKWDLCSLIQLHALPPTLPMKWLSHAVNTQIHEDVLPMINRLRENLQRILPWACIHVALNIGSSRHQLVVCLQLFRAWWHMAFSHDQVRAHQTWSVPGKLCQWQLAQVSIITGITLFKWTRLCFIMTAFYYAALFWCNMPSHLKHIIQLQG